jgi:hypothetical protein
VKIIRFQLETIQDVNIMVADNIFLENEVQTFRSFRVIGVRWKMPLFCFNIL